jgi:hypothetical protein
MALAGGPFAIVQGLNPKPLLAGPAARHLAIAILWRHVLVDWQSWIWGVLVTTLRMTST